MKRKAPIFLQPPHWPALMTADIARAYLGDISRQLFHAWTRSPDFPSPAKIHGFKRWSRSALDAWIEKRADDPAPPRVSIDEC